MPQPVSVDPRPTAEAGVDGAWRVSGRSCHSCTQVSAFAWPRCPTCRGEVTPASFGPGGLVWSSTVVRIPVPGHSPPYTLAYVDLDDGPRILAHVVDAADAPAPIGGRDRLVARPADGDLRVEVAR